MNRALLSCFLLFVIPLGMAMALITPPGDIADETTHIVRADALLHGTLIGARRTTLAPDGRTIIDSGMRVEPSLIWCSFNPETPHNAATLATKRALPWSNLSVFVTINPVAAYFPIFYVPAAIGIGLGKAAGLSPFHTIKAARLLALLFYAVLGAAALSIARQGAAIIFLTLALPMSLSLGASCNPDGILIALAALAAALASRGARAGACICLAAIILVKPPYALMAGLLICPLPNLISWPLGNRILWRRLGLAALTVLPGMLWFIYGMATAAAPTARPPYHPGPLWPKNPATLFFATDPGAQARVLLAHPLRLSGVIWQSILHNPNLLHETIGVLGWLNVVLPQFLYSLWLFAAAAALLADSQTTIPPAWHWRDRILVGFIVAGTVYLVWLSQYLVWTNVGLAEVDGPTGRYILPVLPLLGLAASSAWAGHLRIIRPAASAILVAASLVSLAVIPGQLIKYFYMG